jgi:putative solute:sodium symporter small subunit
MLAAAVATAQSAAVRTGESADVEEVQANTEQTKRRHRIPSPEVARAYWRGNLKLLFVLMAIWFVESYGFGVLLVEPLNRIPLWGFKLGFWWAQQGSIYVFIALIFYYCRRMNRLEQTVDLDDSTPSSGTAPAADDTRPR